MPSSGHCRRIVEDQRVDGDELSGLIGKVVVGTGADAAH